MKIIEKMIERLNEEVDGAEDYAEIYIENKARGNHSRANRFKEMALDELKHASYLREMDIADLNDISRIHTLSESDQELWGRGHRLASERIAIVKQMLDT